MSLPQHFDVNSKSHVERLNSKTKFYLDRVSQNNMDNEDYASLNLIQEVLDNLLSDWPNSTKATLETFNHNKNNILAGMIEQLPPLYEESFVYELVTSLQDSLLNENITDNLREAQSAFYDYSITKPSLKEASKKIFNKDEFEQIYILYKEVENLLKNNFLKEMSEQGSVSKYEQKYNVFIFETLGNVLQEWGSVYNTSEEKYFLKEKDIIIKEMLISVSDLNHNTALSKTISILKNVYDDIDLPYEEIFEKDEFEQFYIIYKEVEAILKNNFLREMGKQGSVSNDEQKFNVLIFETLGKMLQKWSDVYNTPKEEEFLKSKDVTVKEMLNAVSGLNSDSELGKIVSMLKNVYAEINVSKPHDMIKSVSRNPQKIAGMINAYNLNLKKNENNKAKIKNKAPFEQQWRYASEQLLAKAGESGNDTQFIDFKLTEKSKSLFNQGNPEQGYIGVANLLTGDVHLFPCFNLSENEAAEINKTLGITLPNQSNLKQRQEKALEEYFIGERVNNKYGENFNFNHESEKCMVCVADPLGGNSGQAHQAVIEYIGYKDNDRENLVGFGVFKGGKDTNELIQQFRDRSASINSGNFIYRNMEKPLEFDLLRRKRIDEKNREIFKGLRESLDAQKKEEIEEAKRNILSQIKINIVDIEEKNQDDGLDRVYLDFKNDFEDKINKFSDDLEKIYDKKLEDMHKKKVDIESVNIINTFNADLLKRYNHQKRSMPKEISDKLLQSVVEQLPLEEFKIRAVQYDLRLPLAFSAIKNTIIAGDLDALKNLIDKGHNVNQHFAKEIYVDETVVISPLQACMEINNKEMIALLLQHPNISLDDEQPSFFEWFYKETPVSEIDENINEFYSAMNGERALAFALKSNRMNLVKMALAQMNETLENVDIMPFLQQGFKLFNDSDLKRPADNQFKEFIINKVNENFLELDVQVEFFIKEFNEDKESMFLNIDPKQEIDTLITELQKGISKLNTVSRIEAISKILEKNKNLVVVGKNIFSNDESESFKSKLEFMLEKLYSSYNSLEEEIDVFLSDIQNENFNRSHLKTF